MKVTEANRILEENVKKRVGTADPVYCYWRGYVDSLFFNSSQTWAPLALEQFCKTWEASKKELENNAG